jgi:hypothetical protein
MYLVHSIVHNQTSLHVILSAFHSILTSLVSCNANVSAKRICNSSAILTIGLNDLQVLRISQPWQWVRKVHHRTGHEGPDGECMCSSTLSFTCSLDRGGWSKPHTGPLYLGERFPVPILQEAVWAPCPVWTGTQYLAHTGIRSWTAQARSQSQYRPRYPIPQVDYEHYFIPECGAL